MTSAAIYARVSSARQKKDETIGSQTQALREHAAQARLDVPEEWVFEDEGHSGATLVRPALEALRDLVAQGCVDVVLCYSPDRLARKFAYQALLLEEFARAGVRDVDRPHRDRLALAHRDHTTDLLHGTSRSSFTARTRRLCQRRISRWPVVFGLSRSIALSSVLACDGARIACLRGSGPASLKLREL